AAPVRFQFTGVGRRERTFSRHVVQSTSQILARRTDSMVAGLIARRLPIKLRAERLPALGPIERHAAHLIVGDVPEWAADVIDFRYDAASRERHCHSEIRWIAAKVFEHGESPFQLDVGVIERAAPAERPAS